MIAISAKYVLLAALLAQASAPPASAEDKAKAKALLSEGLSFNRKGQHAQALEKFQAAYAAYPSPKLWFNIGQVELALDHPAEAAQAFEKFLAQVPDAQPGSKKDARAALAQLGRKLGRLQIKCETEGAEVAVDGKNVGRVPLPGLLWAMPGSHRVAVTREGHAPAAETVEMSAGATALLLIRLVPMAAPAPAKVQPTPRAVAAPAEAREPALQAKPVPQGAPGDLTAPAPVPAASAGLDLSAQPTPAEQPSQARPFYKTWWFWTGAAVVVAGAATAAILLNRQGGSNVPEGDLGNHGIFQ